MMRKTARAALVAATLSFPLAATAQVLEIGADQSPAGLDPHIATAFSTFLINSPIYEGLTAIDQNLRVVPALATAWTISADQKTYTFTLRPNVTFHDGTPMQAEDVAATMRRVLNQQTGSPLRSRIDVIQQVSAPAANQVVLQLSQPSANLLTSLATIHIVPRRMENDRESLQRAPVGTGPFRFQQWVPDTYISLQRHAGYWEQGLPRLEGLKFNIVPEAATRLVGISSGTYAMLPNIDPTTAQTLRGRPNVNLVNTLELAYTLIGMNTSTAPFNDPRVREAVNYAINRQQLVQAVYGGAGVPGGPLSPALRDWALEVSNFPCYTPNPTRARELLAAAGHGSGLAFTLNVLPRQDIRDVAQVVQAQLNQAGFRVELKNQELGSFIQDWRNSNFQAFASTNAGSPDPDDYFYRTFRTGGSTNVFKYTNTELDTILDRARTITDAAQRRELYNQAQRILACQGPIAHVAYAQLFTALRSNVQGFEVLANRSLWYLRQTQIAR